MHRILLNVISCFFILSATSQNSLYKHSSTLAVNVSAYDFKNPQPFKTGNLVPGLSLNYLKGLGRHLDFQVGVTGAFPDSTFKTEAENKNESFLFQIDFSLRTRFLGNARRLNPYFLVGSGASLHYKSFGNYLLAGPGIELAYKNIYFLLDAQYREPLAGNLKNHYYYNIGIAGVLSNPKKKQKRTPIEVSTPLDPVLADTDRDSIIDSLDKCPLQPGLLRFNGCPDSDQDGIIDSEDKCLTAFGFLQFQGCPFADMDKDGIEDDKDKCPDVPGVMKWFGCPVPDNDGDGVHDDEDLCREDPGIKQLKGCPQIDEKITEKINEAAKNIIFESGSYKLLQKSFEPLDNVVQVLKKNSTITLTIEGHTDNVGGQKANLLLSKRRAQAVLDYIASKNIDKQRLNAIGYGMEKRVADNNTSAGKAKNRRVALLVRQ